MESLGDEFSGAFVFCGAGALPREDMGISGLLRAVWV
jgi:hypothetical protein